MEASRRAHRSRSTRRPEPEKQFLRTYSHLHNRGLRLQSAHSAVPAARLGPFGTAAAAAAPSSGVDVDDGSLQNVASPIPKVTHLNCLSLAWSDFSLKEMSRVLNNSNKENFL